MEDEPDIVARLRRCGCCDSFEAADEIERLRAIVHNLENATDRHPQRKQEDTTNDEQR